jgi:hypothetical protein
MDQVDVQHAECEVQAIRSTVTGKFLSLRGNLVDALVNNQLVPARIEIWSSWTKKAHVAGFANPLDQSQRHLLLQHAVDGWIKDQHQAETQLNDSRRELDLCDQRLTAFDQGLVPTCLPWHQSDWPNVSKWIPVSPTVDMQTYVAHNKSWLHDRIMWQRDEINDLMRAISQRSNWIQQPLEWVTIKTQTVTTITVVVI